MERPSPVQSCSEFIYAILNKHGSGVLYFGVRQDGEVVGQSVEESSLRKASQAIGNAIAPAIRPAITRKTSDDGKAYVEVKFSGDEPHTLATTGSESGLQTLIGDDESLNAKEKDVCAAILNRGEASSTSIAADLEMSTRTARRILADLVERVLSSCVATQTRGRTS